MKKLAQVNTKTAFLAEPREMKAPLSNQLWKHCCGAPLMIVILWLLGLLPAYGQVTRLDNPPVPKTYKVCERVSTNFTECKVCEDQKMTVNCKTYWCTDDGTCEEKKKISPPKIKPITQPRPPKVTAQKYLKSAEAQHLSSRAPSLKGLFSAVSI